MARAWIVVCVAVSVSGLTAGSAAARGKPPAKQAGYDISYPQCGGPFPSNVLFGTVGVNDGIPGQGQPIHVFTCTQ